MKKFLVVGLGAFGTAVAKTLHGMGHTVVGVDFSRPRVDEVRDCTTEAIEADATDRDVLESLDPAQFDAAVVGVGRRLDASILICLFLMELGVGRIVAKVLSDDHNRVLRRLGVPETIFPESDSGVRLGHNLGGANVVDLLPLGDGIGVMEVPAPGAFVDQTMEEIGLRRKYGLLVVAIRRKETGSVDMRVGADTRILEGDILVVIGPEEALSDLPG